MTVTLLVLGIGASFLVWRIRRVDHIARAMRETGIEPDPRPSHLCMVLACHKTWVLSIDGWRTCAEHAKTQGLAAIDRERAAQEFDAWEREIAGGEGA